MWLKNPTRILITPHSQTNTAHGHPGWALLTELITCRLWRITTAPRLSTQGQLSGKQPGMPWQHITVTGNIRARAPLTRHTIPLSSTWTEYAPLTRHSIPLSSISTSKLFTENGGIGVCWDQTLCKPADINKKTAGPSTTKDCRLSSPASSCESSPTAATTQGPKPSSICCRWTKNNW